MSASLLGLTAGLLLAAAPDGAAQKDLQAMQGSWTVVSAKKGGNDEPSDRISGVRLTITGDKYVVARNGNTIDEGTFTVDAGKKIDFRSAKDENLRMGGVYQVEGDTLTEAVAPQGTERPTALASKAGTEMILVVLRREKR